MSRYDTDAFSELGRHDNQDAPGICLSNLVQSLFPVAKIAGNVERIVLEDLLSLFRRDVVSGDVVDVAQRPKETAWEFPFRKFWLIPICSPLRLVDGFVFSDHISVAST